MADPKPSDQVHSIKPAYLDDFDWDYPDPDSWNLNYTIRAKIENMSRADSQRYVADEHANPN